MKKIALLLLFAIAFSHSGQSQIDTLSVYYDIGVHKKIIKKSKINWMIWIPL